VNSWLKKQGLLTVRTDACGPIYDNARDVDWPQTKAFAYGNGKIRLNVKGREPNGCIEPGALEATRTAIMDAVARQHWADRVFPREALYRGSRLSVPGEPEFEAPDIVFTCTHGPRTYRHADCLGMTLDVVQLPNSTCWSGVHEGPFDPAFIAGTFIMSGPGVRRGASISGTRIIDVAPTILHLLEEPAPDDMDGRILLQALA
jgi:predicted AlkP superfamily phosphohydrolase/phosphomutase